MDHEFINAYINRMLALNSELTNKNVMLETKLMLLEKRYEEVKKSYEALAVQLQPPVDTGETGQTEVELPVVPTTDEHF